MVVTFRVFRLGAETAAEPPTWTLEGVARFSGQPGNIRLARVTEEAFPSHAGGTRTGVCTVGAEGLAKREVSFRFENVPQGTYCIKAFQDVDGDRRLEIGRFGPKEPSGFYRPSRPTFRGPPLGRGFLAGGPGHDRHPVRRAVRSGLAAAPVETDLARLVNMGQHGSFLDDPPEDSFRGRAPCTARVVCRGIRGRSRFVAWERNSDSPHLPPRQDTSPWTPVLDRKRE